MSQDILRRGRDRNAFCSHPYRLQLKTLGLMSHKVLGSTNSSNIFYFPCNFLRYAFTNPVICSEILCKVEKRVCARRSCAMKFLLNYYIHRSIQLVQHASVRDQVRSILIVSRKKIIDTFLLNKPETRSHLFTAIFLNSLLTLH